MADIIEAPWDPEQVVALNRYQVLGAFHEFTCAEREEHPANPGVLVATEAGWICPAAGCQYVQRWAHALMAEPTMPSLGSEPCMVALEAAGASIDAYRAGSQVVAWSATRALISAALVAHRRAARRVGVQP